MGNPVGEAYRLASSLLGVLCKLPADTDMEMMTMLVQLLQTGLSNYTSRLLHVEVQAWAENHPEQRIILSESQSSMVFPALAAIPALPRAYITAAITQVQQEFELKADLARQKKQVSSESLVAVKTSSPSERSLRRHRVPPARLQDMVEVPSKPAGRLICIYCHEANKAPSTMHFNGRVALCKHLQECHAQGRPPNLELACPHCKHQFRSNTATFEVLVSRLMKHTQNSHGFEWESSAQRHKTAVRSMHCCLLCKEQGRQWPARKKLVSQSELLKHVCDQHVVRTGGRHVIQCPYCTCRSVTAKARASAAEMLEHMKQAHPVSEATCSEEPASQLAILSEVAAQEMSLMKQTQQGSQTTLNSQPQNPCSGFLDNKITSQSYGEMHKLPEFQPPSQSEHEPVSQLDQLNPNSASEKSSEPSTQVSHHTVSQLDPDEPSQLGPQTADQTPCQSTEPTPNQLLHQIHLQPDLLTTSHLKHQDQTNYQSSRHSNHFSTKQSCEPSVSQVENEAITALGDRLSVHSVEYAANQCDLLKPSNQTEGLLPIDVSLVPADNMPVVPLRVLPVTNRREQQQAVQVAGGHSGGQVTIHVTVAAGQPVDILTTASQSVVAPVPPASGNQESALTSQVALDVPSNAAVLSGGQVIVKSSVIPTEGPSPGALPSLGNVSPEGVKLEGSGSESEELDSDLEEEEEEDPDFTENSNTTNPLRSKAVNKRKAKNEKCDNPMKRMKKEANASNIIYCVLCTDPKSIKDKCVASDAPTFSSMSALKEHLCSHLQGSGMDQYLVCPVCGLERHTIYSHTRSLLTAFLNHVYRAHAVCYSSSLRQHRIPHDLEDEDDMHCPSTALHWPCQQADTCVDFPNRMQLVAHLIEHHLLRCKNGRESSLHCRCCPWVAVGQDGTGRGHIYISNKYVDHCILSHGLLAAQRLQHGTIQRPLSVLPRNDPLPDFPGTLAFLEAAVIQARHKTTQQPVNFRKYVRVSWGQGAYYCFLCTPPVQHFDRRADLIDHFFETHIEQCESSALLLRCSQCLKQCSRLPSDRSMMKSAWGLIDFLLSHMVKVHGLAVPDYANILTCTFCGLETILSEWVMCYHLRRTHSINVVSGDDAPKDPQDSTKDKGSCQRVALMANGPSRSCPHCTDTFQSCKALYIHVRFTHHKLKNILCHMCGKAFYQDYELVAHAWSIHKVNLGKQDLVECDVCGEQMVRKLLNNHRKKHSTELYTCDQCGRTMKHHANLMSHLRKHEMQRTSLACQGCSFSCASRKSLANHMARVHGIQRYQCQLCKHVALGAEALKAHLEKVHADGSTVNYCVICKKQFCNKGSFENHMFVSHNLNLAQRPVLECVECGMRTLGAALMRKHMANHMPITDAFRCDICHKAFKNARQKREHEKRSHGTKNHQCPHCSYTATTESHFARHTYRHHRNVQAVYACSQCMYMSLHADRYANHLRRVHGVGREEEEATLNHLAQVAQVDPSRVGRALPESLEVGVLASEDVVQVETSSVGQALPKGLEASVLASEEVAQMDPSHVGRALPECLEAGVMASAEVVVKPVVAASNLAGEDSEDLLPALGSATMLLQGLESARVAGENSYNLPTSSAHSVVAEPLQLLLTQSEGQPVASSSSLLASVVSVVASPEVAALPPSSASSPSLGSTSFVASPYIMDAAGGSLLPVGDTVVSLQGLEQLLMPSHPTSLPEFATIAASQAPVLPLLTPSSTPADLNPGSATAPPDPAAGFSLPAHSSTGFSLAGTVASLSAATPSASILAAVGSPLYPGEGNSHGELLPLQYEARLMAAISQLGEEVSSTTPPPAERRNSQSGPVHVAVTSYQYSHPRLDSISSSCVATLSLPASPAVSGSSLQFNLPMTSTRSANSLQAALPSLEMMSGRLPSLVESSLARSLAPSLSPAVCLQTHTPIPASSCNTAPTSTTATPTSTFSLQDLRFCSQEGNTTQLYLPPD